MLEERAYPSLKASCQTWLGTSLFSKPFTSGKHAQHTAQLSCTPRACSVYAEVTLHVVLSAYLRSLPVLCQRQTAHRITLTLDTPLFVTPKHCVFNHCSCSLQVSGQWRRIQVSLWAQSIHCGFRPRSGEAPPQGKNVSLTPMDQQYQHSLTVCPA